MSEERPARIALASYWYPVSVSRHLERGFRFLRQLYGVPVEVTTFGPTSGASIPWGRDFRYPRYAFSPDHRLPADPHEAMAKLTALHRRGAFLEEGGRPRFDLWVDVDDGWHMPAAGDRAAGDTIGAKVLGERHAWRHAIVATDPHVRNYDAQRRLCSPPLGGYYTEQGLYPLLEDGWKDQRPLFFSMQPAYAEPGDRVLLYGFDEECHRPVARSEFTHDVTVLGAPYARRREVAVQMRRKGLRVLQRMGDLWDELREATCAAPLALTWTLADDVPGRLFESLAMRRCYLQNRVSGLEELFPPGPAGVLPMVVYGGVDGAVEDAARLAACPWEAATVAEEGFRRVWEAVPTPPGGVGGWPLHSWTARAAQILQEAGLLAA